MNIGILSPAKSLSVPLLPNGFPRPCLDLFNCLSADTSERSCKNIDAPKDYVVLCCSAAKALDCAPCKHKHSKQLSKMLLCVFRRFPERAVIPAMCSVEPRSIVVNAWWWSYGSCPQRNTVLSSASVLWSFEGLTAICKSGGKNELDKSLPLCCTINSFAISVESYCPCEYI